MVVLGLNHRTAPVEIREKFSIDKDKLQMVLANTDQIAGLKEAVVLSTCNRSEIYAVVELEEDIAPVVALWQELVDIPMDREFRQQYTYEFWGKQCIEHLLLVAASLDSLVIGEGQILSQVKHAYAAALENGATDTMLNLLFHRAIATGKRVRTETRIAYSAVSVSYAAVELAKNILGGLDGCRVLLFGAGKMAELTATHLLSQGAPKLFVANHHIERALSLAERFQGQAVPWTEVYEMMGDMDIIITSTGAPHYVIRPREMAKAMAGRRQQKDINGIKARPLILIDIAVPRDVDPEVGQLTGVDLFNIDDLESVVDENLQQRQQEAVAAREIVEEEVHNLLDRYQYLGMQPVMSRLRDKAELIRRTELKRAMRKLHDLPEEDVRIVENMTKMLVRKLLREPMSSLHDAIGTQQEQELKGAMENLFQLESMGNEVDADA